MCEVGVTVVTVIPDKRNVFHKMTISSYTRHGLTLAFLTLTIAADPRLGATPFHMHSTFEHQKVRDVLHFDP